MANGHIISKGLSRKHHELIDLMLNAPELSNSELAKKLELSEPWISTIKNTDLFQEEFRKQLALHRERVSERIITKTESVVDLTLDRMKGILTDPDQEVGLGRLAQVFEITSKRLFPEPQRGASTVVNIALADSDAIRRARERADRLRGGSPDEGTLLDVSPVPKSAAS